MSLEQVDQLINILYNERIKEQREEIEQLRSIKTYGIYHRYIDGDFADYEMQLFAFVNCSKKDIIKHVDKALDKLLPNSRKIWPANTDHICIGSRPMQDIQGNPFESEKIYVKELPQNELTFTLNFCDNH